MAKLKIKNRTLRVMKQAKVAGTNREIDASRKAMKPGLRISKTGKIYFERREQHSDVDPKKKL